MSESQYIPDPDELEDDAVGEQDELYEHYSITADRGQSPLRLDKFLTIHMERCSRNRIQTAADAGNILVNGKPAKSSYKVKPGDRISLVMPYPKREIEIIPENIPLEIPYEDDDLPALLFCRVYFSGNLRPKLVRHRFSRHTYCCHLFFSIIFIIILI